MDSHITRTIPVRQSTGPCFLVDLWTQYEQALNEDIATNNCIKSWNRTWNNIIHCNSNCWKVIEGFVGEEGQARRAVIATATGQDLRGNTGRQFFQHNKYQKISAVLSNYRTLSSKEYLNTLASISGSLDE